MPFKVVVLGKLGSGKGTQAEFLGKKLCIPVIQIGRIYRQEIEKGTEIGKLAQSLIDNGNFMPCEITNKLVFNRIQQRDCINGFIIEGYPRTIKQAEFSLPYINTVVNIDITDEMAIERLRGRRVHKESGRTYHIVHNPPKIENKDDVTGEPLVQRADDREDIIKHRLSIYYKECAHLVGYYKSKGLYVVEIDGAGSIGEVEEQIHNKLISGAKHA